MRFAQQVFVKDSKGKLTKVDQPSAGDKVVIVTEYAEITPPVKARFDSLAKKGDYTIDQLLPAESKPSAAKASDS